MDKVIIIVSVERGLLLFNRVMTPYKMSNEKQAVVFMIRRI